MSYKVEYEREGRGGWVYYAEDREKLPFEWDITIVGFDIYVPTPDEWDAFCEKHGAHRAKGRRQEILQRVAEGVRKQRAKRAKVSIDDTGISFSYEGTWFHKIMTWILGV